MLDATFEAAFKNLYVYNILFEDAEVDGRYLRLDEDSTVLGISAAGCGLASMVRFQPRHIDAVDINGHHLALAALKMKAARDLSSHALLYALFGHGAVGAPKKIVEELSDGLPPWIRKYWSKHHGRFEHSFYQQGLTAKMLGGLRDRAGLGTAWMHEFVRKPVTERASSIRAAAEPVMRKPVVKGVLNSPLQQLALGVNYAQKDRMLEGDGQDIVDFMLSHLERVAKTDVETNWFAWYAAAGHYNHGNPEAVPPYLRKTEHEKSYGAHTRFDFHHQSIFDVLERGKANTWSHYTLCDAVDWMTADAQRMLFDEILRTARPGAIVLMRSVNDENLVEARGRGDQLIHLRQESERASQEDRSCQYKRVDFFQVAS